MPNLNKNIDNEDVFFCENCGTQIDGNTQLLLNGLCDDCACLNEEEE